MKIAVTCLLAVSSLSLAACATGGSVQEPVRSSLPDVSMGSKGEAATGSAHDALFAVFAEADERYLELNPLDAMFRGDMRHADQLGDYFSASHTEKARALAQDNLAALERIERDALSPTDQLAYDVFAYDQRQSLKGFAPDLLAVSQALPINHFSGFHTYYPEIAGGGTLAPFETIEDYENNLKRNAQYVDMIDRIIARYREGMESGVVDSRLTIGNMITQLDRQLALEIHESPFWQPVENFPASFTSEEKDRLQFAYLASIETIYRANERLRDFLRDHYYAVAREGVGLSQMKGGRALYLHLIENSTTLPLGPGYLHDLGLAEVARIKGELDDIRREVGFEGTLTEFFDHVRTDPQFKPASREALTQRYYEIGTAVDARIGDYFALTPKAPLEIKPYPADREQFSAGGSYESGTPDGSRPGIFYFNAYDLPSRLTTGNVTLYLHEGAPGHHFQISLAQENTDLPAFMRFGGTTAFLEGWALYAETLGYEMGFFDDPWNRYGTLQDEQLRAMRLVVDTGIHAKGWTRDQAIDYMLENSGLTRTEVVSEVERYIAIPGQALAYKIGALKIQELRKRAEEELGADFDLKAFHTQVLDTGGLPLPVLEAKIDRWIAEGGG